MHQVKRMHRTLVVLAVGLLALAAPLVAYADGGGPSGKLGTMHRTQGPLETRALRVKRALDPSAQLVFARCPTLLPFRS